MGGFVFSVDEGIAGTLQRKSSERIHNHILSGPSLVSFGEVVVAKEGEGQGGASVGSDVPAKATYVR